MVSSSIVFGVLAYAACSSSLLLLNKMAVMGSGSKTLALLLQFVASIIVVLVMSKVGSKPEPLRFSVKRAASFFGVAVLFCICLYTNVKVLEISNVETVIVFRSLSPMFVCVVEVFVMRSRIPSMWTWLCLCGIGAGAYGYCISEREGLTVTHYWWVAAYLGAIVAEMVYVKFVITRTAKDVVMTTSEKVFYNNALSIPVIIGMASLNGELRSITHFDYTQLITHPSLLLACAAGVGISYAGFNLRTQVSATTYTVVGVANKLATLLVNFTVWEHHAKVESLVFICLSIACATAYGFTLSSKPTKQVTPKNTVPKNTVPKAREGKRSI